MDNYTAVQACISWMAQMSYVVKTYDARGRCVGVDQFTADDDAQAQAEVRDLLRKDWSQELWCESRFVRSWAPTYLRVAARLN